MTKSARIRRALLPVLVLIFGGFAAHHLLTMREPPPRTPRPAPAVPVEVVTASTADGPVRIQAQGTLVPSRQIDLQAEVTGRVVRIHPALQPGGRIEEGAELLRIDERDYRLALSASRADIQKALSDLEMERGHASVAAREWALLGDSVPRTEAGRARALRQPQMRSARARLEAARSELEKAKLALTRTRVQAPFDAVVLEENVDVGQVVRPGEPVAKLVGTDAWWVQVAMPVADLGWLSIPGAEATIRQDLGNGRVVVREGRAIRVLSDVDPVGLMARVLVEVADPLALKADRGEADPLLLGAVVDVTLEGRAAEGVTAVPRSALRDGDTVWTVRAAAVPPAGPAPAAATGGDRTDGPHETLDVVPVEVVRREIDRVLVRADDLPPGTRVVVSRLAIAVPGMAVRVTGAPDDAPGGAARHPAEVAADRLRPPRERAEVVR